MLDTLVECVIDKEEKVKQNRYQRTLLDYFEIHGKSLSILQWAATKEIKATSMCALSYLVLSCTAS